jgi:hypothetical protein
MDGKGTCHERLCRDASRFHARAAKFIAFDNSDGFSGTREPSRQGWARMIRPENDRVELSHRGGQRAPSM